jgi:decaprenyl-phosphate phosphoribosyltransferase
MTLAVAPPDAGQQTCSPVGPGSRQDHRDHVGGVVRLARPRQWVKNLLVVIAPLAGGVLFHPSTALRVLGALGAFCLASAGTYAINDACDVEHDRAHPVKQARPVASGAVTVRTAWALGIVWLAGGVVAAWLVAGWRLSAVVAAYELISAAYSRRLKHEPIVDLLCVSSGFVLRAAAGGIAVGIALSGWFLLVVSFGALLVVCGKRSAEQDVLGPSPDAQRPALAAYPPGFLRSARVVALAGTLLAYCLWAFERAARVAPAGRAGWLELTVVPVVFVLLHLELAFQQGKGSAPEDLALGDRALQVAGVAWLVLFAVGVYA